MIRNGRLRKTIAALLCASCIFASASSTVSADELTDKLDTVQRQMQEEQGKQAEAEERIGTISEQLYQIQVELDRATAELKAIEGEQMKVEADIAVNERLLAEAEARLAERERIFRKRVRDIYINGKLSYLDVIIGAKDFGDFAGRVELLRRIIRADIDLISEIKQERALIAEKKAVLEADRARLVALADEARAKQAEVETKKAERQALLERAMSDRDAALQAQAELQAASESIKELMRQRDAERQSGGSGYTYVQGTGQLTPPVNAVITSPFGYRIHPIFGTRIFHSGTDFGVDEGEPVHAADSGTVAYSGWMSGYGYTIVIDHGNGMSTLYAHNSDLAVSEGQGVSRGQVVAYAGSTGNSTGPHVHFEVRINGEPVDPMGYL